MLISLGSDGLYLIFILVKYAIPVKKKIRCIKGLLNLICWLIQLSTTGLQKVVLSEPAGLLVEGVNFKTEGTFSTDPNS